MKATLWIAILAAMLPCLALVAHAQDAEFEPDATATTPTDPAEQADAGTTSQIPAVMAIIETKPTTPPELFRAAEIVTDLGDLPVAKRFLTQLVNATPSDETLADLWERFGTARFVRLKQIPELNPEAGQLAERVQAAAEQRATDPARLAQLTTQLQSDEPEDQRAAIELLRTGRGAAVNALLSILQDPAREAEHAGARRAIVALGEDAFGPLVAARNVGDAAFQSQVITCLARIPREDAWWYLLAPALAADSPPTVSAPALAAVSRRLGHTPTVTEGAAILFNRAQAYYDRRVLLGQSDRTPVEVWTWDAASGQAVKNELAARDAGLHFASLLAADARRLAPQEAAVETLYYGTLLEAEQIRTGAGKPLPDGPGTPLAVLKQAGVDVINNLLREALRSGHSGAAAAAAQALGDLGDVSAVQSRGATPSPLVEALLADDRRVRFMALRSIIKLDPREAFAGSSYVTKTLDYFLRTAGEPRAVVAGPNMRENQRLAGLLMESGYAAEGVDVLGNVMRVLNADADCELLLVDVRFAAATSGELIARLRRDPRTAKLPIGVVYSPYDRANPTPLDNAGGIVVTPDDQQLVEALARRFDALQPIVRPQEASQLTEQLAWLEPRRETSSVPQEERLEQAKYALSWTHRLAEAGETLFPIQKLEPAVRALLPFEQYTQEAAETLAILGTASGQRDLANLASNAALPIEQRTLAATAFAESVRAHGILLTTKEIELQYDRYNASKDADEATQKLLGGMLDVIEGVGK